MVEATQYTMSTKELVELIIKQVGVREGLWNLAMEFGVSSGIMGPTPDQAQPGLAVLINRVGIIRVGAENKEAAASAVDASLVNPAA